MNFSDFAGQLAAVVGMREAVQSGRTVHAYLFTGPAGTGKRTLADICARALNCRGENKPCDTCAPCKRFLSGNFPDVMYLEPDKSIGVDDVRALVERLSIRPYEGGQHIAIIKSADKMTPQAQNALLKTLESPPEDVTFFLVADSTASILPTVLSRCRVIRFQALSAPDAERALMARGIAPERAQLLARLSMGSVGRALSMNDSQPYWILRDRVIGAIASLKSPADVGAAAAALMEDKGSADALDILEMWARDRMAVQEGVEPVMIDQADALDRYMADGATMLRAVMTARRRLSSNVAWQYALEMLFFEILGGIH